MDSVSIKSRVMPAQSATARPSSVRTDLAPSQSVTAATDATTTRNSAPLAETVAREALIDPQSRNALYREIDERRRKSRRAPDEALQRMRAYGRIAAEDEHAPDADPRADLEV
jgi:hypothetical protein